MKIELIPSDQTLHNLGIALIVLKLCGVVDFSWWLVALPFYGFPALVLFLFLTYRIADWIASKL